MSDHDEKILAMASIFARNFNGECLSQTNDVSTTRFSMVKGQSSIKFKCCQGHVFYKPISELGEKSTRKFSLQTAASSCHNSDEDSDNCEKAWCPKCVIFFRSCKSIANLHGFTLQGKLFRNLAFRCQKSGHLTKISYSRRMSSGSPLSCSSCQKQEREKLKAQLKEEEQQRHDYFARRQEEEFQKASAAMQEELKNQEEPVRVAVSQQQQCSQQEQEVNTRAKIEAEAFLKKEQKNYDNLSMEQAYLVYKFVFIAEELIVKGLMGMPREAWQ